MRDIFQGIYDRTRFKVEKSLRFRLSGWILTGYELRWRLLRLWLEFGSQALMLRMTKEVKRHFNSRLKKKERDIWLNKIGHKPSLRIILGFMVISLIFIKVNWPFALQISLFFSSSHLLTIMCSSVIQVSELFWVHVKINCWAIISTIYNQRMLKRLWCLGTQLCSQTSFPLSFSPPMLLCSVVQNDGRTSCLCVTWGIKKEVHTTHSIIFHVCGPQGQWNDKHKWQTYCRIFMQISKTIYILRKTCKHAFK